MKKCTCRGKDNLFGGDFLSEMKILIFVKRDSLKKNSMGKHGRDLLAVFPGTTILQIVLKPTFFWNSGHLYGIINFYNYNSLLVVGLNEYTKFQFSEFLKRRYFPFDHYLTKKMLLTAEHNAHNTREDCREITTNN